MKKQEADYGRRTSRRIRLRLVCGQGRLEAFVSLGESEISAVVIQASHEDCFVMSLVENLARRNHLPLDLMRTIGELRKRGYTIGEIATKTDSATSTFTRSVSFSNTARNGFWRRSIAA